MRAHDRFLSDQSLGIAANEQADSRRQVLKTIARRVGNRVRIGRRWTYTPLDPGQTACDEAARSEQKTSFADHVHSAYDMGLTSIGVKLDGG